MSALAKTHEAYIEPDPQVALLHLAEQPFDLLVVALNLQNSDGLGFARKCARSTARGIFRS
jgi:two-component system cell cycle response regulator